MPAVAGYASLYNTHNIQHSSSLSSSPSYHLTGKQSHAYSTYNQKNNVICYFTNWATDRFGDGKYVPENVKSAAKYCTHIYYAYAKLDPITLELAPSHVFTDETNGFFDRVVSVSKNSNPNIKVLLSMGGWTDSGTDKYSKLVADPNARANFAEKAAQMLKKHEFDGLSIEWQYPVCWQADCKKGNPAEKQGFVALAKVLKNEFSKNNLILSASLPGFKVVAEKGYDVIGLAKYL